MKFAKQLWAKKFLFDHYVTD